MNTTHLQHVRACLDTLQHAQNLIDTAAQQLCSVPGFADEWSSLGEPHDAVKAAWHRVYARRVALTTPRDDGRCVCCGAPLVGRSTCTACDWVQPGRGGAA